MRLYKKVQQSANVYQIFLTTPVSSIISGERPNRVNAIRDGGTDDLSAGNDDNDENEDDASVVSDQSQPSCQHISMSHIHDTIPH